MADHAYEMEIRLTDAKNNTTVHHAEYISPEPTTKGAIEEVVKAIVQQKGHSRVKDVASADR